MVLISLLISALIVFVWSLVAFMNLMGSFRSASILSIYSLVFMITNILLLSAFRIVTSGFFVNSLIFLYWSLFDRYKIGVIKTSDTGPTIYAQRGIPSMQK